MKRFIPTIIAGLMLISFSALSQTQPSKPQFGKGYYNIADNQQKLSPQVSFTPDTLVADDVKKGYYSIKGHQQKLKQRSAKYWRSSDAPRFTKGYYTIGDNAKKLYEPK